MPTWVGCRRVPPRASRGCSSKAGVGDLGKLLIAFGLLIALVGVVLTLAGRLPWLGRLPGDIYIQRGTWSFYFPLATSLLVSVILSLLLFFIGRR